MAAMDMTDRDCQKRLIKTFVNAIYLYDDHFDIAFNYTSNGKMVVKMQEINDTTSGEVFGRCAQSPAIVQTSEPLITVVVSCSVFVFSVKMPEA